MYRCPSATKTGASGLRARRRAVLHIGLAVLLALPATAAAHRVYIGNDEHTDYGWNATTDENDAAILGALDYYLAQIRDTAGNSPDEQARYSTDGWYWLYLYERNRSPERFAELLAAMRSGHLNVPQNPLVVLYGALPTEAAIRLGYYAGKLARRFGVEFPIGQEIENVTVPWGMASVWAGSGARYSWKGICACATSTVFEDHTTDLFRWRGPDDKELLTKWYAFVGPLGIGGYAETRDLLSPAGIQRAIDRFTERTPGIPLVGLFGGGGDDVVYQTTAFVDLAKSWNATHDPSERVVVSNQVDFFRALEAHRDQLPTLRGGWGSDWDLWPIALAEPTARTRRAVEKLRTAEALAAVVHVVDPSLWVKHAPRQEAAFVDYAKYFEHTWSTAGPSLESMVENKRRWAASFATAVDDLEREASARFAELVAPPGDGDGVGVVVFNPLLFERTDYADLPLDDAAEALAAVDVETGEPVPSQLVIRAGARFLRTLAPRVPSLGYRTLRLVSPSGTPMEAAATVSGRAIENARYRITLGQRGEIASWIDRASGRELARGGLNDFGTGTLGAVTAENAGPVSVTLRAEIDGSPPRRVRITLFRDLERIEIDNEILGATAAAQHYRFDFALERPEIDFEEVGAIARPGKVEQGGSFLPGARTDYLPLNHFVLLRSPGAPSVVLSSAEAQAFRIGQSTPTTFDLGSADLSVLALGNVALSAVVDQGGDARFTHRFALSSPAGAPTPADAMRASLAHQNPLRALRPRGGSDAPLRAASTSLLRLENSSVVGMAVKPAEEGERAIAVRLWELAGVAAEASIDAAALAPVVVSATTLSEVPSAGTTGAPGAARLDGGTIRVALAANEIASFRLVASRLGGGGRSSGIQISPDRRLVLVTKRVGEEQWSIVRSLTDGTVSGTVYFPNGADSKFVSCVSIGDDGNPDPREVRLDFSCRGAERCDGAPCAPDRWSSLGEVSVPGRFFLPE